MVKNEIVVLKVRTRWYQKRWITLQKMCIAISNNMYVYRFKQSKVKGKGGKGVKKNDLKQQATITVRIE
jgi:hypothetical protein